jgi:hypothetical protein
MAMSLAMNPEKTTSEALEVMFLLIVVSCQLWCGKLPCVLSRESRRAGESLVDGVAYEDHASRRLIDGFRSGEKLQIV